MTAMRKFLLAWLCLQLPLGAHAGAPKPGSGAGAVPDTERYARRCQSQAPHRTVKPQGTLLWGTRRSWDTEKPAEERSSVLVSASLQPLAGAKAAGKPLTLEDGHLGASPAGQGIVGTVLQGKTSDGTPVEVAICGAEPSSEDPRMVWYRIEAWNALAQEWENPCVALHNVPDPRALALGGVWDASGAHHASAGQVTFACENGALSKCAQWGYKPWASRGGESLDALHQACTRMARADYCGNGKNHTHEETDIDMYDRLGVIPRTTESSAEWDLARASFEAAWAPDGATCLARTRDGRALATILQECPGRFQQGAALDLGGGDRCAVRRTDVGTEPPLLRNQSYGAPQASSVQGGRP